MLLDVGDGIRVAGVALPAVASLEGDDPSLDGGLPVGEPHHVDLGADQGELRSDLLPSILQLLRGRGARPRRP